MRNRVRRKHIKGWPVYAREKREAKLFREKGVDLVAIERPPTTAASKHKPRPGLNDISVLSKVCYGHSLRLGKAVIWRMSVRDFRAALPTREEKS
jgi:hypothetical protein